MSQNQRLALDYAEKYKILTGRVIFANYTKRRQEVDQGRLLGLHVFPPTNDASIIPRIRDGEVNTTPEELAGYLGGQNIIPVQPITVPDAPTSVSALAGNTRATVSFTAPANDGGSPITGYTVTSSPGGFTATGASSPLIVTGLANGALYTFTVVATNIVGNSAPSSTSSAVTPGPTVPDAPTSVSALAGNAQAAVSFTAPVNNGGSAITGYTVTSSPGGFTATGASSPLTVTGLTNGTLYTFRVVATNSIGNSTPSSASSAVTPSPTVPDAPTSVSALRGNTQATVSFTAPANNGGSPITGYTVTSSPGGFTATGASSPLTVTGLTNGTSYTFTVVATNIVGNSAPSSASSAVIPAPTVPDSPTSVSALAGNRQAAVSFTAPVNNGGSAITGYTVTSSPGGFVAIGSSSPLTVTGLTNGTSYTFRVVATNSIGNSTPSSASSAVTPSPTVPGAPTSVSALGGNTQATVSFTAPVNNGGSAITGYTVTSSPGGFTATGSSSPLTVTGLTNGTSYTFTVVATNIVGNSAPSSASSAVTPNLTVPGAPTSVSAEASNAQAIVSFIPPVNNGGSPITSYTVTSSPGGFTATGSSSPLTVTGLTNGTSYTFRVVATNSIGTSAQSSASSAVRPGPTVPDPPTSLSAVAGIGQATLSFSAPASDGGSPITSYTATSTPGGIILTVASSPVTFTGLINGAAYTFRVVATNSIGDSVTSAGSAPVTPRADRIADNLTTSLAAYNSAPNGVWVKITTTEYGNLRSTTPNNRAGASDTYLTSGSSSSIVSGDQSAIVANAPVLTKAPFIEANNYVFACAIIYRQNIEGTDLRVYTNTDISSWTGFTQLGNVLPATTSGVSGFATNCYVLKRPATTIGTTRGIFSVFTGQTTNSGTGVALVQIPVSGPPVLRYHTFTPGATGGIPNSSTILERQDANISAWQIQALTTIEKLWP